MAVTFQLPPELEKKLRAEIPDLDAAAKETYVLQLFRSGKITHYELSTMLGLDRNETDAYLKHHGAFEGSLSSDDIDTDRQTLERVVRQARG